MISVIHTTAYEFPNNLVERRIVVRDDGKYVVEECAHCIGDSWQALIVTHGLDAAYRAFEWT